jgi:LuxR family maltose regulon positive regulatory protein
LAASVSDPRLFVVLAVSAGQSGRTDRCAHWLTRAEPFIESDSQPLPGWRTLRAHADAFWASFPAANDAAAALTHARRAVALEDDPQLYGYAVARLALGGALRGAGQLDASLASLRDAWESPARRELPGLLLLQCAGLFAMVLIETGDLDGARAVCRDVHEVADAAERAWGQGAAAALAILRLSEARLTWATDPAAATPAYQRAAELAEGWGWSPVHLSALCGLAGSLWAAGDRAGARTTLDRAREVANSGQARPANVRELQDLESRLGRSASKTARVTGGLYEELTDRELAILRALRGPLTAREIGSEMFLSINTVKGYTKRLYRKLGVVTREDAVRRGHELGLI